MNTDITVRLRLEGTDLCIEAAKEIDFLRECLTQAEVALATAKGTLARPAEDEPSRYTYNYLPSAPPHDE